MQHARNPMESVFSDWSMHAEKSLDKQNLTFFILI